MKAMTRSKLFILTLFLLTLGAAVSGCTDSLLSTQDELEPSDAFSAQPSKFRHAHLLDRAIKSSDGVGKSANNGNKLGLILGVRRGIDKQGIVSRYGLVSRYGIVSRYEYDHAMYGLALIIEDSLGGDFQPLLDSLEADPDIEFFEPDIPTDLQPIERATEPGTGSQVVPPGLSRIGGHGNGASGVDVFVFDTGVSNDDVNVVESVDLTDSPSGSDDIDGHGTHVAGTIAAINDTKGVVGVAPGARIRSLKVVPDIDPNPDDPDVDLSTAIAAVEHATGQKLANPNTPMVVNISLGADIGTTQYNALDEAIEASSAAGVVYVVAAGNEGIDASTVTPAHAASAITVGAYDPANDLFGSFSNYGQAVDILAPGVDVLSLDKGDGQDAAVMSGTSMATAYVSGAVALFLADNPQASVEQVRAALDASASAAIQGVPAGTTDKTVRVTELMQMQVPPFFQYALTVDHDLNLKSTVYIGVEGNTMANANIFANHDINLNDDGHQIEGFAYYGHQVTGPTQVLQPRYNPTNLPPAQQAATILVPTFQAEDYQHLATQTTDGDLLLSGHYPLGTREKPVIWYVGSSLKTDGDVSFSGYGIFLVKNDIAINHQMTTDGDSEETTLALYTGGSFKVNSPNLNIEAQVFVGHDLALKGNTTIYGNATVGNQVKFNGDVWIYYRPAAPALTEPLWPMQGAGKMRTRY